MPLRRAGPEGSVCIEGVRPVAEAIRAGRRTVHRVHLGDGSTPGLREVRALAARHGIEVRRERPSRGLLCVADADPLPEEDAEAILVQESPRFLVALDRVTDVGNLGSIARSAEGAGVGGLILEHRRAPPIEPGALRASAGALEHLRVGRTPNLGRTLDLASAEGLTILAADPGGVSIAQVEPALLEHDLVIVFGSEDRGLRESIRRRADRLLGIPLLGRIGSFGVAASAAYLLLRIAEGRAGLARGL